MIRVWGIARALNIFLTNTDKYNIILIEGRNSVQGDLRNMALFFFRYSLIFAIGYILLFFAKDQNSSFFLVKYVEHIKILAFALFVLAVISHIASLFFGSVKEISGKKCVRCNRPALKGFIYCHEHLQKANEKKYEERGYTVSGRR